MSALECLIHTVLLGILVVFEVIQRQVPAMTRCQVTGQLGAMTQPCFDRFCESASFPHWGFRSGALYQRHMICDPAAQPPSRSDTDGGRPVPPPPSSRLAERGRVETLNFRAKLGKQKLHVEEADLPKFHPVGPDTCCGMQD